MLDFGLAKLAAPEAGSHPLNTMSPTLSVHATLAGVILGTAAYMSPEQARGKTVDKRADIWAFGCVLYEILTGRRAFDGQDLTDTIVAIVSKEPDWSALPSETPAAIRSLLRRCVEKDAKRRLRDIGEARLAIEDALSTPAAVGRVPRAEIEGVASGHAVISGSAGITHADPASVRTTWRRTAVLGLAFAATAIVAGAAVWFATRPEPARVSRLTITPSSDAAVTLNGTDRDVAITPDGAHIVYVGGGGTQLFVRELDQIEPTPLRGFTGTRGLFLSPDSQWIGFFEGGGALKKVAITGGPAVTMTSVRDGPRGATWGPDQTIVFATSDSATGLQRVSSAGGEVAVLTKPNRDGGEADHLWPEFLPGGQGVLFTITPATGSIDNAQVAALDLRTGTHKILVRGGSHAHYVASGHLVYGVAGTLRAVAFDLARLEVIGTPVPVVPQLMTTFVGAANFDVAQDGTLVYMPGSVVGAQTAPRTLIWVDRAGREAPIKAPVRAYTYPRLSPDGTRVALQISDQMNDIWVWDLRRETLTRLTFDPGQDSYPVWMPDGRRLLFSASVGGQRNVVWQAAEGTGQAERLNESSNVQVPFAVSPDGTRVVVRDASSVGFGATYDLILLLLDKDRRAEPLLRTSFSELNADISPDGRWLAYESDESGQREAYARPFPNVSGGRWQVSTGGGTRPVFSRGGQELFYLATTGATRGAAALMSVGIQSGPAWVAGTPMKLFEGPYFYNNAAGAVGEGRTYDASSDGRRFLMIKNAGGDEAAAPPNLVVV